MNKRKSINYRDDCPKENSLKSSLILGCIVRAVFFNLDMLLNGYTNVFCFNNLTLRNSATT